MKHALWIGVGVLAAGWGMGCNHSSQDAGSIAPQQPAQAVADPGPATRPAVMAVAAADEGKSAVAEVHGAGDMRDKIHGKVTFTQESDGVKIVAEVEGLPPGKHGIHVHEKNDLSKPDLSSAGGHFNPGGASHHHAGPEDASRHAGDLGNIDIGPDGKGRLELVSNELSIEGKNGVVGHSVIIHRDPDDMKTQPAGNSGPRIAGGAIVADEHHHQPNE